MVTYMERHTVPSYMSVTCTRRTLRMPSFTRATHAQPSLSNFPWRDSDFGERTHSCGTTRLERNFPTSPQNKKTKLTHCSIYVPMRTISTPTDKMNIMLTLVGLPQKSQLRAVGGILQPPNRTASRTFWKLFVPTVCTQIYPNKITINVIPTYLNC